MTFSCDSDVCRLRGSEMARNIVSSIDTLTLILDYRRFKSVLLVDQITVIGNKMCISTPRFANICAQIKQI